MPSNVVHCYFAQRVYDSFTPELKAVADKDKQAYLVGAQGPDLLFYMRFEKPPLNKLGEMLHRSFDTANLMRKSALYAKQHDSEPITAFLLGQLCHYALDSELHSYIYHREKDLPAHYPASAAKYIHVVFESGLDYLCIRDYLKGNTKFYKSYKNLNISTPSRNAIGQYYSSLVAPEFGMELPVETAARSVKLMRLYCRILDDATGIKYGIVRGLECLLRAPRTVSAFIRPRKERVAEDWLNKKRTPYPKYRNRIETATSTVEEMASFAHAKALSLITDFYGFLKGEGGIDDTLYNKNYAGDAKEETT
ncbi:MAG: zinc dependent phospholipase C family protein [Clostridia bacterium]|nr:zinc dependent phospholipase C family protein [Clostridia bacterium]